MDNIETAVQYMDEIGWFSQPVYVVWTHGCTDGWPKAIFLSKEHADEWLKVTYLNPEGYDIEAMDMIELAKKISALDKITTLLEKAYV